MCIEFAHTETVAATLDERTYLREQLNAPPNWQVYLALYKGVRHAGSFWHRAALFEEPINKNSGAPNMQATTIHVGHCFFHVLSAPVDLLPNASDFEKTLGMRQIWPIPASEPQATRYFTDAGANRVATKFFADHGVPTAPHLGMQSAPAAWLPYGRDWVHPDEGSL